MSKKPVLVDSEQIFAVLLEKGKFHVPCFGTFYLTKINKKNTINKLEDIEYHRIGFRASTYFKNKIKKSLKQG